MTIPFSEQTPNNFDYLSLDLSKVDTDLRIVYSVIELLKLKLTWPPNNDLAPAITRLLEGSELEAFTKSPANEKVIQQLINSCSTRLGLLEKFKAAIDKGESVTISEADSEILFSSSPTGLSKNTTRQRNLDNADRQRTQRVLGMHPIRGL